MTLRIRWLGVSGFEVETERYVKIYIDPYLDRRVPFNPPPILASEIIKADIVVITHGHFDHFEDTPTILRQTNSKLVASRIICNFTEKEYGFSRERLAPLDYDETIEIRNVKITATKGEHYPPLDIVRLFLGDPSIQAKSREELVKLYEKVLPPDLMKFGFSVPRGPLQGYLIVTESGFRVWNVSETTPIEELKTYAEKFRPQIVLVAVISNFEQNSVKIVEWVRPRIVIPHSFDRMLNNQPRTANIHFFQEALKRSCPEVEVLIPNKGKTYSFDVYWKEVE